jgi:hypothetical protein
MATYHFYTAYLPKDPESQRRHKIAQSTWPKQPWLDLPIRDEDLPRLYREDGGANPYVKDVFDLACKSCTEDDVMIYTNADIMVRSDCVMQIVAALQNATACYAYRRDFHHQITKPVPDTDYEKGMLYAGSDLFAFRKIWWDIMKDEMPDMIIGYEAYDPMLRLLADETNPHSKTRFDNLICHERHGSIWEKAENRYTLKGQLKCLSMAKQFFSQHGINPAIHGIR